MSFCEMSNMLPSGSCVLMPANGRVDGRLSHFTVGYFCRMRSKQVSVSSTWMPKWSRPAERPARRGLMFSPT